MGSRGLRLGRVGVPGLVVAAMAVAGCGLPGSLSGRASDEWTRSYPLTRDGEVAVTNTNGSIDVDTASGDRVGVEAERIAHASTDASARDLLARITITESIAPDRVSLETPSLGFLIAAGFEVRYHVHAPKSAAINVRNTNGRISLAGFSRRVEARTTNGSIVGNDLGGGVRVRTTNGNVNIVLVTVGPDPVEITTTNGRIDLTLPPDAKADLSASLTNGTIDVSDFRLEETGDVSRRHLEGRLNGGGPPIQLRSVNGTIRLHARDATTNR